MNLPGLRQARTWAFGRMPTATSASLCAIAERATPLIYPRKAWLAPIGPGPLNWQCLGEVRLAMVPGGSSAPACIPAQVGVGQHYLLVAVSASEDASNLDAATRLPCASGAPPDQLEIPRDLVANDNNLALRLIL